MPFAVTTYKYTIGMLSVGRDHQRIDCTNRGSAASNNISAPTRWDPVTDNVLLVTVDSLRKDAFERYRKDRGSGPVADLAERGVSFERAYATGMGTNSSFPGMLTGTKPLSYGGLGPLCDDRPRVSTNLAAGGIDTTGAFHCNPFLSRFFNYDRGYDVFEDYQNPLMGVATKLFPRGIEINNPRLERADELLRITDFIKWTYRKVNGKPRPYVSADVITDDAVRWLDGRQESFFGWVHYMDVHHPCHPPREYRERFGTGHVTQAEVSELYSDFLREPRRLDEADIEVMRGLYDAAIDYTADQVGRLLETLSESNTLQDTMVVFTSDHGELFGEHGYYGKPERMYDELVQVPLVIANGPDRLADATEDLVSLLDIPPTMHDALGQDVPAAYEGRLPYGGDPREDVTFEHAVEDEVVVAARSDEWLFEVDQIRDERRLHRSVDGRQRPVEVGAASLSEAERAVAPVHERLSALDVEGERLEATVEGDVEDRLEELGYL